MTRPPNLIGPTVTLRAPRDTDAAERLALGHDPHIIQMYGGDPSVVVPMTPEEARQWLDRVREHPRAWIVEHDHRLLGHVRLDNLDAHDARASLAIGFADKARLGQGLGRQAIALVLDYVFDELHLHRVGVRVVAYNTRAIRCYAACGFIEEGREREAALVGMQRHDDVLMGILATDYRKAAKWRGR